MKRLAIAAVCLLQMGAARVAAQALITGENGGKGSQSLMLSANLIFPKDFTLLPNFWVQYGRGLHSRVDAFALVGSITAFGRSQQYVGVGSNIGLVRRQNLGMDVAFYNLATFPVNRGDEASTILLNFALVASRPVKVGNTVLTPYGGVNSLAPAGRRADKLFTPADTLYSGIVGIAIPLRRNWSLFLEYDPGRTLRSAGAGLTRFYPAPGQEVPAP